MTSPRPPSPFQHNANEPLTPAAIQWNERGQPFSSTFQDVYFSSHDGLEESRYVFLQHSNLAERWRRLPQAGHSQFIIGETGFGTGLNFLATWELWRNTFANQDDGTAPRRLHYISIEKHPLAAADLRRALALWPSLQHLSEQLIGAYPPAPLPGFHRLIFDDGAVTLTLIFTDVASALRQLQASQHVLFAHGNFRGVDAWYLDGFAPAKNPAMWDQSLMPMLAKLSRSAATVATYTVAGDVRRALQRAGFSVEKKPGFRGKREMLTATLMQATAPPATSDQQTAEQKGVAPRPHRSFTSPFPAPWFVYPSADSDNCAQTALIVGAGLAGCHSARALAQRGWQVTVLDKQNDVAQAASGNPQSVLYAKLSADNDALAQFNLASLLFAQRFYRPCWQQSQLGGACGALYLAHNDNERRVWQQLSSLYQRCDGFMQFVQARQASDLAGVAIECPGIFFPDSGWLNSPALCRALLDHPNIAVVTATKIDRLLRYKEGSEQESKEGHRTQWQALDGDGRAQATATVAIIANAADARALEHSAHLPLKSLRGQLSQLADGDVVADLKTVLCGAGYIAPPCNGRQSFGATFSLHNDSDRVSAQEHRQNIDNVISSVPSLAPRLRDTAPERLGGRVSFRCTTPDYLPVVGCLPDRAAFVRDFGPLRKNANAAINTAGSYLPNLYINVGHGSRGLAYTPLCAELLAALINGEPLPVPQTLVTALNPARFLIRDLIRNKQIRNK